MPSDFDSITPADSNLRKALTIISKKISPPLAVSDGDFFSDEKFLSVKLLHFVHQIFVFDFNVGALHAERFRFDNAG